MIFLGPIEPIETDSQENMPIADVIRAVATELDRLNGLVARLEDCIFADNEQQTYDDRKALQSVDLLQQSTRNLTRFLMRVSDQCHKDEIFLTDPLSLVDLADMRNRLAQKPD